MGITISLAHAALHYYPCIVLICPHSLYYHHNDTWGDANGFSHIRATLTGQSLTIPFEDGKLLLGTWQQVVLAEFDNRPRKRQITIRIIGK